MRTYELMLVFDPRLAEDEISKLVATYREMIESAGGKIEHEEDWGRRKLAYPIRKLDEARYLLLHLSAENGSPTEELEQRLRQNENVLRFLTVRTDRLDIKERKTEDQPAPAESEEDDDYEDDDDAGEEDDES